jgi:hypothetical protein
MSLGLCIVDDCDQFQVTATQGHDGVTGSAAWVPASRDSKKAIVPCESIRGLIQILDRDLYVVELESRAARRGAALERAQRVATRTGEECGAVGTEECAWSSSSVCCCEWNGGAYPWRWSRWSSGAAAGSWCRSPLSELGAAKFEDHAPQFRSRRRFPRWRAGRAGA